MACRVPLDFRSMAGKEQCPKAGSTMQIRLGRGKRHKHRHDRLAEGFSGQRLQNIEKIYISISRFNISIYPSIHPSIYLSFFLSIHPSIYLSIYPSIHLSFFLSIHPSIFLSIYPSIHLSFFLSITYLAS